MSDDTMDRELPPYAAFLAHLTLHPAQAAFVAAQERFAFYVGGVGAGKTYAGAVRALRYVLERPGSLGLVGAPTYPMLRDATIRMFFELLERAGFVPGLVTSPRAEPREGTYLYNKSEGHLRLPQGTEVLFRSLDEPDRVRGLNLAWFWLDEAALCGHPAWQLLKGRLRQRGYEPAGWATGTPRGRDGFYRDFELAPRPDHLLVRASTQANAANLPPHYVEDLGYSGALYEQEVLGLFTAFAGLVYQLDTTSPPPLGHLCAPAPGQTFARVIGGVDWGYTNPTAAVVFGLDGDGRAWQVAEWCQRRAPLADVVLPALVELTQQYGVQVWYCGPDEPEHIAALARELRQAGLACRAVAADNAVVAGLQTVTRALALRGDGTRGLYIHPTACPHTLAEYASYQYPPRSARWGDWDGRGALRTAAEGRRPRDGRHALRATRCTQHCPAWHERRRTCAIWSGGRSWRGSGDRQRRRRNGSALSLDGQVAPRCGAKTCRAWKSTARRSRAKPLPSLSPSLSETASPLGVNRLPSHQGGSLYPGERWAAIAYLLWLAMKLWANPATPRTTPMAAIMSRLGSTKMGAGWSTGPGPMIM